MTVAKTPDFLLASGLRVALGLFCVLCACASSRRDEGTLVSRERPVLATAEPGRDRWFATLYALQSLLGADEGLRAQTLSRLSALLGLSPDADPDAIVAALRSRVALEQVTLSAPSAAPPALASEVRDFSLALSAQDLDASGFEAVLALENTLGLRVACEPAEASVCADLAPELSRALRAAVVRAEVLFALATTSSLREAIASRGEALRARARGPLAAELSAGMGFLRGLHARSAAMADANTRRAQWIRAIAAPDSGP